MGGGGGGGGWGHVPFCPPLDPGLETAHLDLCYLQKPINIACGSERVILDFTSAHFSDTTPATHKCLVSTGTP